MFATLEAMGPTKAVVVVAVSTGATAALLFFSLVSFEVDFALTASARRETPQLAAASSSSNVRALIGELTSIPWIIRRHSRLALEQDKAEVVYHVHGVHAHGQGLRNCTVGETCAFSLSLSPPATWAVDAINPLEWDLMVVLEGPALLHADVAQSPHPPIRILYPKAQSPGIRFTATYCAWDPGQYTVRVLNLCHSLQSPDRLAVSFGPEEEGVTVVAEWSLTVAEKEDAMVQRRRLTQQDSFLRSPAVESYAEVSSPEESSAEEPSPVVSSDEKSSAEEELSRRLSGVTPPNPSATLAEGQQGAFRLQTPPSTQELTVSSPGGSSPGALATVDSAVVGPGADASKCMHLSTGGHRYTGNAGMQGSIREAALLAANSGPAVESSGSGEKVIARQHALSAHGETQVSAIRNITLLGMPSDASESRRSKGREHSAEILGQGAVPGSSEWQRLTAAGGIIPEATGGGKSASPFKRQSFRKMVSQALETIDSSESVSRRYLQGSPEEEWSGPCAETVQARWLQVSPNETQPEEKLTPGAYRWTPYPCARWTSLGEVLKELESSGAKEVAFVGDSHLRLLLLHAAALLTGAPVPEQLFKAHSEFTLKLSSHDGGKLLVEGPRTEGPKEGTPGWQQGEGLTWRFYWVDGIFRNMEYGCRTRGIYSERPKSFPTIEGRPELAVLNSGAWTAFRCHHPALAYAAHLDDYLQTMVTQLRRHGSKEIFFLGGTPKPLCCEPCGRATGSVHVPSNSLISFMNKLAEVMAQHHGVQYLSTWEIAAPRFTKSCKHHYSCPWRGEMRGCVGQAMAKTFIQLILLQGRSKS